MSRPEEGPVYNPAGAGGMAVLGGIIAGPALLAPGTVMRATASANLENAYANLAEVKRLKGRLM